MKAAIRRLHSPDVFDLATWRPPEQDFGILVQMLVGPADRPGEESFDVTVCTAGWLAGLARADRVVDARHHLVVDQYDFDELEKYLQDRVSACDGSSWDAVAEELSRLGRWEFEDYRTN